VPTTLGLSPPPQRVSVAAYLDPRACASGTSAAASFDARQTPPPPPRVRLATPHRPVRPTLPTLHPLHTLHSLAATVIRTRTLAVASLHTALTRLVYFVGIW
jgi:hypothetical protein